jgi:hypothetical protein
MDNTPEIVCHAFLNRCPPEQKEALIGYLSSEEALQFKSLQAPLGNPEKGFELPEELLTHVHFSWLAPILRALSETEIRLFLSSLSEMQVKGLKQQLLFSNHLPTLSPLALTYLKTTLFEQIAPSDLLPPACLPTSKLNALLDFKPPHLQLLVDLLSMHDLAVEIRHIIDTVKLKRIYSLITPSQQSYLKTLSHKKEPVAFKKIGLNHWNGDTEALQSILIQRGMNRLAKALYGTHPSLIWYLTHRFDIEKGQMLQKLCTPLDHPRAATILTDQIVSLSESFKPTNPA